MLSAVGFFERWPKLFDNSFRDLHFSVSQDVIFNPMPSQGQNDYLRDDDRCLNL